MIKHITLLFAISVLAISCNSPESNDGYYTTNKLTNNKQIVKAVNKLFVYTDNMAWEKLQSEVFEKEVLFDMVSVGADKTGIRLSPFGGFNDMEIFDTLEETYEYLAGELAKLKLAYIHIVDHSSMGTPEVPEAVKTKIGKSFGGTIIASGGFNKEKAEAELNEGKSDLVAFGRSFLAIPDLVHRIENDLPLNAPDFDTFYLRVKKDILTIHFLEYEPQRFY